MPTVLTEPCDTLDTSLITVEGFFCVRTVKVHYGEDFHYSATITPISPKGVSGLFIKAYCSFDGDTAFADAMAYTGFCEMTLITPS